MPGKPTYDLQHLQQLVGQGPLTSSVTTIAADGAASLGWFLDDVTEAVLLLTPRHFYKTMQAESSPGLWQDVYHLQYRDVELYIKLQIGRDGRGYVIQFKQR